MRALVDCRSNFATIHYTSKVIIFGYSCPPWMEATPLDDVNRFSYPQSILVPHLVEKALILHFLERNECQVDFLAKPSRIRFLTFLLENANASFQLWLFAYIKYFTISNRHNSATFSPIWIKSSQESCYESLSRLPFKFCHYPLYFKSNNFRVFVSPLDGGDPPG